MTKAHVGGHVGSRESTHSWASVCQCLASRDVLLGFEILPSGNTSIRGHDRVCLTLSTQCLMSRADVRAQLFGPAVDDEPGTGTRNTALTA